MSNGLELGTLSGKIDLDNTPLKKGLAGAVEALRRFERDASTSGTRTGKALGTGLEREAGKGGQAAGRAAGKGLEQGVGPAASKAGRKASTEFSSGFDLKSLAGKVAGAVAALGIGTMVGTAIGDGIKGAGNLEQSVGAVDAVFKGSAGSMHKWAATASTSVGLTVNEFNELGTLIGAQLKNGGTAMDQLAPKTRKLIGLGADLSSMFGGTTRDAVEAVSSALKGERDPIERYGVSLTQAKIDAEAAALGFKEVGGSFDGQAQQAATLSLIMKQTSDAQGNFAKESDTFAHKQQVAAAQWEDLKTKIGGAFLPALTAAMGFLTGTALPAFDGLASGLDKAGQFLAPVGAAFGVVGDALAPLAPILQPIAVGIAAGAAAFGLYVGVTTGIPALLGAVRLAMLAVNATMAANPIGLVVALLAALVGAFIYAYNTSEEFRNVVNGALLWVQQTASAVGAWFSGPFVGFFQQAGAWIGAQFQGIGQAFEGVAAWLIDAGNRVGSFFMNDLPGFFSAAASGIGRAFAAVGDFILSPIRGAVAGINTALRAVGAPQIPGFSSGGYTGAGGLLEVAGIVHRGEIVFSQADVARSGGVAAVEAMRLKGFDSGGWRMPTGSTGQPPTVAASPTTINKTQNVTIINPVPEKGSRSITRALSTAAYLGLGED